MFYECTWIMNKSDQIKSNGSKEEFSRQIYCTNWIFDRIFYVTIADADDTGSLKVSLHTLFDKSLDHMLVKFEQNRMVRTKQNYELFWQKNGQPFLTEC